MSIMCLAGKSGVGKDVFGDVLVKKHGYLKIALADPLRELCSSVFHMDYALFSDPDKKDKQIDRLTLDFHHIDKLRDYVDTKWDLDIDNDSRNGLEESHGVEFNTPRDILRHIGNDLRKYISEDIWINIAMEKLRTAGGKVVVTDCRFGHERDAFSKCGALLILIKRNDDGTTFQHEFNLGNEDEYDVIFDNSGTLNEFRSNIDMWYTIKHNELELYKVFKYD